MVVFNKQEAVAEALCCRRNKVSADVTLKDNSQHDDGNSYLLMMKTPGLSCFSF